MKQLKFNKKGQLSMVNIIFFLILAFVMAICSSVMNGFLNDQIIANNYTGMIATLINLVVPFMWLGLVVTFFLYVTPIQPRQY
jgi:MFS-type transporter involved in bile tolerance (Atg22 family)